MAQPNEYRINGRVVDTDTGAGIAGLLVKAWDADLIVDDLVGSASTDARGNFFMAFSAAYFKELFVDRRPDLYFELYYRGRCIYSTEDRVTHNVEPGEHDVVIEIDRDLVRTGEEDGEDGFDEPLYPDPRQTPDVPPDDPVATGPAIAPPAPGPWKETIRTWWRDRKKQREEEGTLYVPERPMPKPYLDCTSNFGPQLNTMGLNERGQLSFTVWNDGNFPAWTCYAELYEGPWGYSHPLSAYALRGRTVLSLRPGERREVFVPWVRREQSARIVGIISDPLLDPKDFTLVEQYNRHITSVHYSY
jgi:hypothetical protein